MDPSVSIHRCAPGVGQVMNSLPWLLAMLELCSAIQGETFPPLLLSTPAIVKSGRLPCVGVCPVFLLPVRRQDTGIQSVGELH